MQPLALDLSSFGDDLHSGRLSAGDWPRLARDCGVRALDVPLAILLRLDPIGRGHYLRQEMEKHGTVIAAVRDSDCCRLEDPPTLCGAPAWTTQWGHACASVSAGGLGIGLVVLRPPPCTTMAVANRISMNVARARYIASEFGVGIAVSNEYTHGYLSLAKEISGTGLALDGDRLPHDPDVRLKTLDEVLPWTRVIRLVADGSEEDPRCLRAWRDLLDAARFNGFVTVSWRGSGDPYTGAGRAVSLLKGANADTGMSKKAPLPPQH
jgi:hypothetical protein